MKGKWLIIWQVIAGLLFILLITQLDLLTYGLRQAKGQWGIIYNAKSIDEVLQSDLYPDSILAKLNLIQEVKEFAYSELGLEETDIYETVNLEKGKYTMYVVTGSKPFQLFPYLWKFPVAGEVPYKGFFDLPLAIKERDRLVNRGLDAGIRTAGGWSTLGWFENPLLSEMLERETGDFVNLILHEMAHETIYIPDSSELNENLATFIGDEGTVRFLSSTYGPDSKEYNEYVDSEADSKDYSAYFIRSADKLSSLYNSFEEGISEENKKRQKEQLIREIVEGLRFVQFRNPQKYQNIFGDRMPNNTYFLSFIRYRSGQEIFYQELERKYHYDLKLYISDIRARFSN